MLTISAAGDWGGEGDEGDMVDADFLKMFGLGGEGDEGEQNINLEAFMKMAGGDGKATSAEGVQIQNFFANLSLGGEAAGEKAAEGAFADAPAADFNFDFGGGWSGAAPPGGATVELLPDEESKVEVAPSFQFNFVAAAAAAELAGDDAPSAPATSSGGFNFEIPSFDAVPAPATSSSTNLLSSVPADVPPGDNKLDLNVAKSMVKRANAVLLPFDDEFD